MVSIFYGHNEQTAVQEDVLLPPSGTWGEERMLLRTSAPRGGGELQSRVSVGAFVAPVRPVDLQAHSCPYPGRAQHETKAASIPAAPASTPHLTWCNLQRLLYRMSLYETGRRGWARKPSPQLNTVQHCSSVNPSFLPLKLFASVLFDSYYFINSINSCTDLLHISFAFQPGSPLKLTSL